MGLWKQDESFSFVYIQLSKVLSMSLISFKAIMSLCERFPKIEMENSPIYQYRRSLRDLHGRMTPPLCHDALPVHNRLPFVSNIHEIKKSTLPTLISMEIYIFWHRRENRDRHV